MAVPNPYCLIHAYLDQGIIQIDLKLNALFTQKLLSRKPVRYNIKAVRALQFDWKKALNHLKAFQDGFRPKCQSKQISNQPQTEQTFFNAS
jgi:hypothetical protein